MERTRTKRLTVQGMCIYIASSYQRQRVDDQAVRHRIRGVTQVGRHALEHRDGLLPPLRLPEGVDAHVDQDGVAVPSRGGGGLRSGLLTKLILMMTLMVPPWLEAFRAIYTMSGEGAR